MHEIDQTTEQMVRSVLAYAENRLRMNPVPLDKGVLPAEDLYERLAGLIRDSGRHPDEVLGVYASVIAPSIISADSPRFLGFIPAAPTKEKCGGRSIYLPPQEQKAPRSANQGKTQKATGISRLSV